MWLAEDTIFKTVSGHGLPGLWNKSRGQRAKAYNNSSSSLLLLIPNNLSAWFSLVSTDTQFLSANANLSIKRKKFSVIWAQLVCWVSPSFHLAERVFSQQSPSFLLDELPFPTWWSLVSCLISISFLSAHPQLSQNFLMTKPWALNWTQILF